MSAKQLQAILASVDPDAQVCLLIYDSQEDRTNLHDLSAVRVEHRSDQTMLAVLVPGGVADG